MPGEDSNPRLLVQGQALLPLNYRASLAEGGGVEPPVRLYVHGFRDRLARQCRSLRFYHHSLYLWSGWEDLNLRPRGPEPRALPGCATPSCCLGEDGGI